VNCQDAVYLVEAIASGDLEVEADVRAHFETCPRCAAALASAERLEMALRARPAPNAPPRFASMVAARIRQDTWRSEQNVDRIFNIAIVFAVLLIAGSVLALTNVNGVLGVAGSIWGVMSDVNGQLAQQAAPTLVTYVSAAGLLMSTLVMWWWAERRLSL
jgi:anti-sigma factor RsiW